MKMRVERMERITELWRWSGSIKEDEEKTNVLRNKKYRACLREVQDKSREKWENERKEWKIMKATEKERVDDANDLNTRREIENGR